MKEDISEIIDEIDPDEVEPEPSLESENAYSNEEVDLDQEQEDAIDRILSRDL